MAKWRPDPGEETETKLLPIRIIETDAAVTTRLEEPDRLIVRSLVTAFRTGRFPPPILVYRIPGNRHILVDGRARIAAAKAAAVSEIMAEIRSGTIVNALWWAAATNRRPQQPRTPAEERLAIQNAIQAAPQATPQTIAEHVGCTVAAVREARAAIATTG